VLAARHSGASRNPVPLTWPVSLARHSSESWNPAPCLCSILVFLRAELPLLLRRSGLLFGIAPKSNQKGLGTGRGGPIRLLRIGLPCASRRRGLLFGYFLLATQEKVTRSSAGGAEALLVRDRKARARAKDDLDSGLRRNDEHKKRQPAPTSIPRRRRHP